MYYINYKWSEEEKIKEKETMKKQPKEIQFLHNCPYFLPGYCTSENWRKDSYCWDCVKKNQYIIRSKKER